MTTTAQRTGFASPASLVRDRAESSPDVIALREKNRGVWREISWRAYWDDAETFANALLAHGFEKGERVGIHSENRPEWLYTDIGSIAAGAICVGFYPTNPTSEVRYLLDDASCRVLIVEDEEQADKTLEIPAADLPDLEKIIYLEHRGVDTRIDPRLQSWDDFMEAGRRHREAFPDAVAERMASASPEDLAYLVYTSGTTGPPKGAMLNLANLHFAGEEITGEHGIVQPGAGPDDLLVSYLPLCHIYEKLFSVLFGVTRGTVVHFGESLDTLVDDLRDVQPTVLQGVPRIWERIHAGALVRLASASRMKRINTAIWMAAARFISSTLVRRDGNHTILSRGLLGLGNLFLFRSLRERAGLRRLRFGVTAAAPISTEILEFFMGIGVPLYEAYGMTENSGVATVNRPGAVKVGSVGMAYPSSEVKLDPDTNEILTRHPAVFVGYWNMPEATANAIDSDGWLHTGDVGEWVDGTHLKIVDRIKDIIIPFIKEAIVIGDRRKYLSCLIGIDFELTSEWAQRKRITHTTYRDLSDKPEVRALVQRAVDATNEKFARVEQIKKFQLLTKELDHEDGELTATQKVKRSIIEDRFGDMIEAMYE
jgi:long-chain acyl-CoA synthetase